MPSADSTSEERVVICEMQQQIRARNNIVRLVDYLSFSWANILVDVATVRPYLPRIVDCFEGLSEAERARIRGTQAYREWQPMRQNSNWQFNRNFLGF